MLIIANVLMFNGGTTFLLRISKMLYEKGVDVGILVLFDNVDKDIVNELNKYAQIYYLKNYIPNIFLKFSKNPITSFLPVNFFEIQTLVKKYGSNVHIMGIFGILFTYRYLQKTQDVISASIGVYHQNEFMFNGANYYFVNAFRNIFAKFKSSALVFFNEHCLVFYSAFFKNDYSNSALLPIGVDLKNTTNVFKVTFPQKSNPTS